MTGFLDLPPLPALVVGEVSHTRRVPLHHTFRQRAYQWLVDVDDLPRLPWWLRPLAGFRAADHLDGGRSGGGIRGDVDHLLARHGTTLDPDDRIVMLANARGFGHVFDPLTVFVVQRRDANTCKAVIFEVHNTYGGRHAYLIDIDDGGRGEVEKVFYVSPFNDVSGTYAVRLRFAPDQVSVTVGLDRSGDRILTATTRGVPEPATRRSLLRVGLTHALMTYRVSLMIRVHGIWLWLRRLPIVPRPSTTKEVVR